MESQIQFQFALKNPYEQLKIVNLSPCNLNVSNGNEVIHIANSSFRNNKFTDLNSKLFARNNSFQFNVSNGCESVSTVSIISNTNQTLFIYLENNQLKYTSLKSNTSDVTSGDSQLKFFGINTNNTFGVLNSTVERGKIKKHFSVQTNYNDTSIKSYSKIAHQQYKFYIFNNENGTSILSDTILLEITGRYTIALFPHRLHSNSDLDYVVLTDITPNGKSKYIYMIRFTFKQIS